MTSAAAAVPLDDARVWARRGLLAVVLLVVLRAALSLGWAASGDAHVFLWLADLATSGGVPYRDAFETKGPMAWMPLVPLVALAGPMAWVPRVVDLAMLLVGALSARRIATHLGGAASGALAATLWAAWWCGTDWWNSAQPDGWAGAWIVAAWALAIGRSSRALIAAGALVGAAALVKPFYAPFLVVPLLAAAPATRRAMLEAVVALGIGALLGIGLPLVWLWQLGGLGAWLACLAWTARVYTGGDGIVTYLAPLLLDATRPPAGVVAVPACAALAVLWRAGRRADALALAVGTLGALLAVLVQRKFWPYHWLPLQPFLAIGFATVVGALVATGAGTLASMLGRWMAALALGLAVVTPAQFVKRAVGAARSEAARAAYEQSEFGAYGRHRDGLLAIVDSLHGTGAPTDRALVWGFYPGVETLLGRRPVTRYGIMHPLFAGEGRAVRDSIRREFMRELGAAPPRWWLVARPTMQERRSEFDAWDVRGFPAADSVLRARYRIAGATRDWIVHERIEPR